MTQRVDYDAVASAYDTRYERNRYDGVRAALERFLDGPDSRDVAEVGCGTGHWLSAIRDRVRTVAGLDLSAQMLHRARAAAPSALLARGTAEKLPWATERFDRLFCVNALHHFSDANAFMIDARRVLRLNGGLMTVGLDPHTGLDTWWIYDYFPAALEADLRRYLPTSAIRDRLTAAGFVGVRTEVIQHMPAASPFAVAEARGFVDRRATSQLMVIGDAEYEAGLTRLRAEQPILRSDLRLYATIGWTPGPSA